MSEAALRRKFEVNIPPSFRADVIKHRDALYGVVSVELAAAIDAGDLNGMAFYFDQLTKFNYAGYILALEERIKLLKLSERALTEFPDAEISTQIEILSAATSLLSDLKFRHLREKSLEYVFPWRPLFERAIQLVDFPGNGSDGYPSAILRKNGSKAVGEYRKSLTTLIKKARAFFADSATDEILFEVLGHYAPFDLNFFAAQSLLSLFLPTQSIKNTKKWFLKIFESLKWVDRSPQSICVVFELFARVAQFASLEENSIIFPKAVDADEKDTLPWDDVIPQFVNTFIGLLELNSALSSSDPAGKSSSRKWPVSCEQLMELSSGGSWGWGGGQVNGRISEALAKILVYNISWRKSAIASGKKSVAFTQLKELAESLKAFFHPSNEGSWSTFLIHLLEDLSTSYVRRVGTFRRLCYGAEKVEEAAVRVGAEFDTTLIDGINQEFSNILEPLAFQVFYSKSRQNRSAAHTTLKALVQISDKTITEKLFREITHSLDPAENLHAHRMMSALECLSEVGNVVFRGRTPISAIGAAHLEKILWNTLPGVDANDLMKTASTLVFYSLLFMNVPIHVAGSLDEKSMDVDDDARSVTLSFSEWTNAFVGVLLDLITNLDSFEKKNWQDKMTYQILFRTCRVFFQSLSKPLLEENLKILVNHLNELEDPKGKKYYGILCAAASYSENSLFLDLLLASPLGKKLATAKTLDDIASASWSVYVLSQAVRHSGSGLLPHLPILRQIISSALNARDRTTRKCGRKLLRNSLASLTSVYPREYKSFPERLWNKVDWQHWKDWSSFPEVLIDINDFEIGWHEPTDVEIGEASKLAKEFYDLSKSRALELVTKISKSSKGSDVSVDDYEAGIRSILVVGAVLEGSSNVLGVLSGEEVAGVRDASDYNPRVLRLPLEDRIGKSSETKFWSGSLRTEAADFFSVIASSLVDGGKVKEFINLEFLSVFAKSSKFLILGLELPESKRSLMSMNKYVLSNRRDFLGRLKYPIRPLLVERASVLNDVRRVLSRKGVPFTAPVSQIFQSLLLLLLNEDPTVREASNASILPFLSWFPPSRKVAVSHVASVLQSKDSSEKEVLGALSLAGSDPFLSTVFESVSFISFFLKSLYSCYVHKSDIAQASVHSFVKTLLERFHYPTTIAFSSFRPTDSKLKALYESAKVVQEENFVQLLHILGSPLSDGADSGSSHWRYQLMASSFLYFLIPQTSTAVLPDSVFENIGKNLESDLSFLRRLAMLTLVDIIFTRTKKDERVKVLPEKFHSSLKALLNAEGPKIGDVIFDGNLGWNLEISPVNVLNDGSSSVLFPAEESKSSGIVFTGVSTKFRAFVDKLAIEHHSSSGESKSASASTGEAVLQSLPAPIYFPRSRLGTSLSTDSATTKAFDLLNFVFLEKVLYANPLLFKDGAVVEILRYLFSKSSDDDYIFAASELLAAVIRFATERKEYRDVVLSILPNFWDAVEKSSVNAFNNGLRTSVSVATAKFDPRSVSWFVDGLLALISSTESVSPSSVLRRLQVVQAFVIEFAWRSPKLGELLVTLSAPHLNADSQQLRNEAARSLVVSLRSCFTAAESPFKDISLSVKKKVVESLSNVVGSGAIGGLEASLMTILLGLDLTDAVMLEDPIRFLLPVAISTSRHANAELAAYAKTCYSKIARDGSSARSKADDDIVLAIEAILKNPETSWGVKVEAAKFLQLWTARSGFFATTKVIKGVVQTLEELLKDSRSEVRETAYASLAAVISFCGVEKVGGEKLQRRLARAVRTKALTLQQRHGGLLGLCAFVRSEPLHVPNWLPAIIALVAEFAFEKEPLGASARSVLSDFKKSHQDEWHVHQDKFTEEQLTALNSVDTAPSYFA